MNISQINPSSLIEFIDSAEKLYKIRNYKGKREVEDYLPLLIQRVGFYGRQIGDEIYALRKNETTFDESEDVVLVIEGNVELLKVPVNEGSGGITYTGKGGLVVDGTTVYSGGGSGGGSTASDISYDNSSSGLSATNVQEGIDVLDDKIEALEVNSYNEIVKPPKQYFLSTIQNNLYLRNLLKTKDDTLLFKTTQNTLGMFRNNNFLRFSNPSVGNYSLGVSISDKAGKFLYSFSDLDIEVSDLSNTATLNLNCIGDSYTDIGDYVSQIETTLPNINFLGMCQRSTPLHPKREGRSGWKLRQYMSETGSTAGNSFFSPFLHPSNTYTYYGNTGFWKKVYEGTAALYKWASFEPWLTTLNIQADGSLGTPSNNDVMYFTDDSEYKVYNGATWETIAESTLDFEVNYSKYQTQWLSGSVVDVVTLLFGMNDFLNTPEYDVPTVFAQWKTDVETLYASIKVANADAKLVIITCQPINEITPPNTGNQSLFEFYKETIVGFAEREGEGYYIADSRFSVDIDNGYPFSVASPFQFYEGSETIRINREDVHLATSGMNQIGVKASSVIQTLRSTVPFDPNDLNPTYYSEVDRVFTGASGIDIGNQDAIINAANFDIYIKLTPDDGQSGTDLNVLGMAENSFADRFILKQLGTGELVFYYNVNSVATQIQTTDPVFSSGGSTSYLINVRKVGNLITYRLNDTLIPSSGGTIANDHTGTHVNFSIGIATGTGAGFEGSERATFMVDRNLTQQERDDLINYMNGLS